MTIGIYSITAPSGKLYVGMSTTSIEYRWKKHKDRLIRNNHHCIGLLRAYNKYGLENLKFEILEEIDESISSEIILQKEQEWWDKYKAEGKVLYNGRPSGKGSVNHTEETRRKISDSTKLSYQQNPRPIHPKGKGSKAYCRKCLTEFIKAKASQIFCTKECSKLRALSISYEEIISFYNDGKSLRKVAELAGVSHITVRNILTKNSVPLRDFAGK